MTECEKCGAEIEEPELGQVICSQCYEHILLDTIVADYRDREEQK